MLKPEDNPPVAWPESSPIRDFAGVWWVAHTKARNEKALAKDMVAKNISYFLPMTWKAHRSRGRIVKSLLPLFGGYLFFCGSEGQRVEVLKTNRAANIIEVRNQDKLVTELVQIEHALKAGVPLSPHQYVKTGQVCRVVAGPLADLQGIVVKATDQTRLVLQIDMLGQAASVQIDANMIEPVEQTIP